MKSWSPYALLVVAAIALDQWIKHLVETSLAFQEKVDLVPFLALYRTYNTGIAFSMFSSFGDTGLIVISVVVVAFVLFLATRIAPTRILARIGFALIVGGALGNLIDRVAYGHVIDYILFHTPVWSFAVFNLADAFISVGAALVVFDEFIGWRREAKPQGPDAFRTIDLARPSPHSPHIARSRRKTMSETFKAILVSRDADKKQSVAVTDLTEADLMDGDVTVAVEATTVNYKDGLAITGKAPVIRRWPLVPGIDFAGTVISSSHADWRKGDKVILNGWGVGETHFGAYSPARPRQGRLAGAAAGRHERA